ncbi:hypothetical protein GCM10009555_024370 [Acrocarpospora macrocephala]|uniref:Uncharacterized protein n=1 Tax=Acrocarpospora macrocephala TaxID=150177 RepID=A0A5M3X233_9ACTN|nr:hypothetical protein Amac_059650 [Acrocarpospora macrocephala]
MTTCYPLLQPGLLAVEKTYMQIAVFPRPVDPDHLYLVHPLPDGLRLIPERPDITDVHKLFTFQIRQMPHFQAITLGALVNLPGSARQPGHGTAHRC